MAKLERTFTGDFDLALARLDQAVLGGSTSATLEDRSDFTMGATRVAVRMYERYSWSGGNRVAMCLTLAGEGNDLHLTAITAGGSQAMFFKINTWGEEAFLDTLRDIVDKL
ncbi:MAG: hypothetical protein HDT37_07840 [Clostridiales bacterium]|nr:hypothetical protein [Clostridiales bacterium]